MSPNTVLSGIFRYSALRASPGRLDEIGISRPTLYDLMEKFGIPKE